MLSQICEQHVRFCIQKLQHFVVIKRETHFLFFKPMFDLFHILNIIKECVFSSAIFKYLRRRCHRRLVPENSSQSNLVAL